MSDKRENNGKRSNLDPIALAMEWVAKITTVACEMFLPAVGGRYLDSYLGTKHWIVVGLVAGFVVGMWHLLQMTRSPNRRRDAPSDEE